jgi:rhomboid protease GluP
MLVSYILTGSIASIASLLSCYFGNLYDYAGGASGAIFGLMGIMIVMAFFNKGQAQGISLWNLVVLSVLTILNGYVSEGIDNVAHIGGLISGIFIGIILILLKAKGCKKYTNMIE